MRGLHASAFRGNWRLGREGANWCPLGLSFELRRLRVHARNPFPREGTRAALVRFWFRLILDTWELAEGNKTLGGGGEAWRRTPKMS